LRARPAAATSATVVATIAAFYLATKVRLGRSPSAATNIVVATLAAGSISAILVMLQSRRNTL